MNKFTGKLSETTTLFVPFAFTSPQARVLTDYDLGVGTEHNDKDPRGLS